MLLHTFCILGCVLMLQSAKCTSTLQITKSERQYFLKLGLQIMHSLAIYAAQAFRPHSSVGSRGHFMILAATFKVFREVTLANSQSILLTDGRKFGPKEFEPGVAELT